MSESSTEKDGQKTVSLVRGERGRFAVGGPGGPGRPKKGESLAESWRRSTDWEKLRTRLESIAHNAKAKDSDAIAAARELLDRSWGRPTQSHELNVTQGETGLEVRPDATVDELREAVAACDRLLVSAEETS